MIMIGPTQSQFVLPLFLQLSRPIPALPIDALALEHNMTSQISPDHINEAVQDRVGSSITFFGIVKYARTRLPKLTCFEQRLHLFCLLLFRHKTAVPAAFDRLAPRAVFERGHDSTEP